MTHRVRVTGIPGWLDARRLLGDGAWAEVDGAWQAELGTPAAADLAARLRGLGFGGQALDVHVVPPLPRAAVRAARTEDARRRRDTTPGFLRPGVRFDDEGRWSLTPEALALRVGELVRDLAGPGARVLDAGAGLGGSTIGLARAGLRVLAVEQDPARLAHLRHHVRLYGVADRVEVRAGDAVEAAATVEADVLHADPPWGEAWSRTRTTADDLPLLAALLPHLGRFRHVVLKLPPSFDPDTLSGFTPQALFGEAAGDRRRVKLLLLTR